MLDSKQIRRRNLLLLIAEARTAAALAEAAQTSAAYLSQILSAKTKAHVGDALARKLEAAARKPRGWMDVVHYETAGSTARQVRQTDAAYSDDADARSRVPVTASVEALPEGELKSLRDTRKKRLLPFRASAAAYALRIRGDHLHPRIKSGEYLIADPERTAQPGDDVIIVLKKGGRLVREYLYLRDEQFAFGPIHARGAMLTLARSKVSALHVILAIISREGEAIDE